MKPDWFSLCADDDLVRDVQGISVRFSNGRSHRVLVKDGGETWELIAVVAGARTVEAMDTPLLAAWARNRSADLVALRVDSLRRLVAGAWAVKAGLSADDFTWLVRRLAREADRLEFTHSGEDKY